MDAVCDPTSTLRRAGVHQRVLGASEGPGRIGGSHGAPVRVGICQAMWNRVGGTSKRGRAHPERAGHVQ